MHRVRGEPGWPLSPFGRLGLTSWGIHRRERSSVTPPERTRPSSCPGDFILTHRHQVDAWFISWAQRRRFKGAEARFAHWSHAAAIVGEDGALVEAKTFGVTRSPISNYGFDEYHLFRIGPHFTTDGRLRAVAYAEGQVGQAFGYLDMLGACLFCSSAGRSTGGAGTTRCARALWSRHCSQAVSFKTLIRH